jgi:hypothetical protein
MYHLQLLTLLVVNRNHLTGFIPEDVKNLRDVRSVDYSRNHFTGRLPYGLSYLRHLETVLLHYNSFSGNLNVFEATDDSFPYLNTIDISGNLFTGKLPRHPFVIRNLKSFAAISNCMSGNIPSEFCMAHDLVLLALDGMGTGKSCRKRIWVFSDSYLAEKMLTGGIPQCLFNMTSLEVLHLSGNGIEGTLIPCTHS